MAEAVADYTISIKLGDAWAMNRIGWFYETNRYLPKDLVKARGLYEQAAAKGNPTAKAALAKMLAIN
jgi:TPR repeat protein